jgi:predicted dehydrogenase
MSRLRIGIIGAGGIAAKLHLPELAELADRAEVVLIAGRNETRLALLRERFNVPRSTTDYEDVINGPAVDAVIVATPHPQHVAWGVRALEAGKHVYMQKPLSGDMGEADAFVASCERHADRVVFCLPHFDDAVQGVRDLVRGGGIGKPTGMRARTSHGGPGVYYREIAQFFGEPEPTDLWFFDAKRAGVGALFDMGVYAVAHVVAVLGSIVRVTAVTATVDKPTTLEDTATLILRAKSGAVATAETSWCDPGRTWQFSVHGSVGKVTLGAGEPARLHKPTALDRDNAPVELTDVLPKLGVGNSHRHWLDCIDRGVQPPVSNVWAARHVTEVLLAGLRSSKEGKPIDVRSRVRG